MLNRQPGDRTLPTLVTLLVIGLLLMTFDVRSEGAGVTAVLRTGTQTIISPLQKAAAFVVNPVVDLVDSISNVATLRERNLDLEQQLNEAEAEVIAMQDALARLEVLEQMYRLDATATSIGRTVAQIIGRPDPIDQTLIIDKGSSSGIAPGQPVIDSNGYVVGSVQNVTGGSATVVPIAVGPDGVAVTVEDQRGVAFPQVNSRAMRLDILEADAPVIAGQRVVTSSASIRFPAGYPVGVIAADAAPSNDGSLTTTVEPLSEPDSLRVVIVLAWPPDPVTAVSTEDDPEPSTTTSTSTTLDGSSTTSSTIADDG